MKLDNHTSNGIFFGYTATTKNIYYIDEAFNNMKIGTHSLFDETYFTVDTIKTPLAAQALQRLGCANFDNKYKHGTFIPDTTIQ